MKFGMCEEGLCFVREDSVRGSQAACLVGGPSQIWGRQPSACTAPLGPHTGGLRRVFCPAHVRFYLVPPAAAGGSLRRCPTGRGALNGDVRGSPMGLALKGYSVGWGAAERLRGVPSRASQWSGRAFRHAHALDLRDRHRLTQENGRERLYPLSPKGFGICPGWTREKPTWSREGSLGLAGHHQKGYFLIYPDL